MSAREVSPSDVGASLASRLRSRSPELEDAILARVHVWTSHQPGHTEDPEYVAGMQATIPDVLEYGFLGIELGEEPPPIFPSSALVQARRAAHAGVSLDVVLRRYMGGHALLIDFVLQEAAHAGLLDQGPALRHVLGAQAWLLDRLMASIASTYEDEKERREQAPRRHNRDRVRRLLRGSSDTSGLGYDVDAWHIGLIARGNDADTVISRLAQALGCQLLSVGGRAETVWAWFGAKVTLDVSAVENVVASSVRWPSEMLIASGEPGYGLDGWRMTHRQATSALRVALVHPRRMTRFSDAALIVPWLDDYAFTRAFIESVLAPLDVRGTSGATNRATLRAYFAAGRNTQAAALQLGVSDRTVRSRISKIEELLGPALNTKQAEMELALRLDALGVVTQRGAFAGLASENGGSHPQTS